MWQVLKSENLLSIPALTVIQETVRDTLGGNRDCIKIHSNPNGYVMIVPVRVDKQKSDTTFIFVEQYRHVLGISQLEFPAGKIEYGETGEEAAIRELKEETGFTAKQIHFLYSTFVGGSFSNEKILFYLADIGDNVEPARSDRELASEMKIVELTSNQVHKLILNNELTNMASMAALLAVMLQNKEAVKYLLKE